MSAYQILISWFKNEKKKTCLWKLLWIIFTGFIAKNVCIFIEVIVKVKLQVFWTYRYVNCYIHINLLDLLAVWSKKSECLVRYLYKILPDEWVQIYQCHSSTDNDRS